MKICAKMGILLAALFEAACENPVEIPEDAADGKAPGPPEGCVARLAPASPPLLANASLECVDSPMGPELSVAAATDGRAYLSAVVYHANTSSGNFFTFASDATFSEKLIPADWTWLRTDAAGNLYRFGSAGGWDQPFGLFTRDAAGWKFEAPNPVRDPRGLSDAVLTPGGVPVMLYHSPLRDKPQSLELLSRPMSDWVNESIGPGADFYFGDGPWTALNVTPDGDARVTYWSLGDAAGLYTWRRGQSPRRVLPLTPNGATLRGVRPSAPVAAISAHFPDGIHALFIDDVSDLVDVGVPESAPVTASCSSVEIDPTNSSCPANCTEAADGAARGVHALARTEDGRYWIAYVAGHFEKEFKYEIECEPCACAPKLVRDATQVKLVIARVTPDAPTHIEIAWQTDALPNRVDLDARGSRLYLAATVSTNGTAPVPRYLQLDTTAFGLP